MRELVLDSAMTLVSKICHFLSLRSAVFFFKSQQIPPILTFCGRKKFANFSMPKSVTSSYHGGHGGRSGLRRESHAEETNSQRSHAEVSSGVMCFGAIRRSHHQRLSDGNLSVQPHGKVSGP